MQKKTAVLHTATFREIEHKKSLLTHPKVCEIGHTGSGEKSTLSIVNPRKAIRASQYRPGGRNCGTISGDLKSSQEQMGLAHTGGLNHDISIS